MFERETSRFTTAVLLVGRFEGLHTLADRLPLDRFGAMFAALPDALEAAVSGTGGQLVDWQPSLPQAGSCICAWPDAPAGKLPEIQRASREALAGLRRALDAATHPMPCPARVTFALGHGKCLVVQEGRRLTRVLGEALNRLHSVARDSLERGDALVVDASATSSPS